MRAAVLVAPGEVQTREVPIPAPPPGRVRVRLQGSGVCGSNLPVWEGRPWFQYPFAPGAPGHEGWGYIDAVGAGVKTVHEGDRVALLSYHAFADYDVADVSAVVRLPEALADRPFPGEALACAINVFNRADVRAGQTVAIVGIGFLGALLTSLCAQAGARVLALSRRAVALEMARRLGAVETIPLADHHRILEQVKGLTRGDNCERVIEAVGQQWPLDLAAELTQTRGRLVIAGYHQDGPRQVNMQLWNWRGLDVINAHERDSSVYVGGIRAAVEAVADGKLNPEPLYTHRFRLEQTGDALEMLRSRPSTFMKALVSYDES